MSEDMFHDHPSRVAWREWEAKRLHLIETATVRDAQDLDGLLMSAFLAGWDAALPKLSDLRGSMPGIADRLHAEQEVKG